MDHSKKLTKTKLVGLTDICFRLVKSEPKVPYILSTVFDCQIKKKMNSKKKLKTFIIWDWMKQEANTTKSNITLWLSEIVILHEPEQNES